MKKFIGFTLAEVLVTLGVIGVVSALTVPSLMNNHQKKVFVTQLHKVYNEFQQAFAQEISDNYAVDLYEAGLNNSTVYNFMNKHFKGVVSCSYKYDGACLKNSGSYKNMNGGSFSYTWSNSYALADGAAVALYLSPSVYSTWMGTLTVDVNGGGKGPNIYGRDLFVMSVYKDGTLKGYPGGSTNYSACKSAYSDSSYYYCFQNILNDGWDMKY